MKVNRPLLFALSFLSFFGSARSSFSESVEEILAQVNKLAPAERQRALEQGARKEGSVKFASNESVEGIKVLHGAFAAKYPFIKVESWRAPGLRGVTRLLLEHRTGKLEADVLGLPFEGVVQTEKEGVLARYDSPERRYYGDRVKDKNGYWTSPHYSILAIGYNIRMVKPEESPRGYQELLQPRFKGELSIDTDPHRAVIAWLMSWGEEKTRNYINQLLRNGMMPRKGHTLQTQLLCAGEFKVGVELHAYQVMQAKRDNGCPISLAFGDPAPASTGSHIGVTKTAPHPHAAALFVDFVLGEEGAKIVAASGRVPTRKGTKALYDELSNLPEKGVNVVVSLPDDAYRLEPVAEKLIKEIVMSR